MNKAAFFLLQAFAAATLVFGISTAVEAQRRNDRDIRDAVRSLNSKLDDLDSELNYQMRSSSADRGAIDEAGDDVRELRDRVRLFQENYDRHRENRDDVNAIIDGARVLDSFLQANPQNRRVEDHWRGARVQIDRLAANYGITASWTTSEDEPRYPIDQQDMPRGKVLNVGLSGTYDLDPARSERTDDILTDSGLGTEQQQDLRQKLEAPAQIAIDIRGNQVTLATSNASPVTIIADGRDKVENSNGRSVRLRATLNGDTLTVSSLGGETDYTIKFTSVSDGRGMKVTRRITTDYLNQTVIAESYYNKTDSVAGLGISPGGVSVPADQNGGYSDNDQQPGNFPSGGVPRTVRPGPGNYLVPDGTIIVGRLDNEINTKVSQNNDRFRLTVQSPIEFRGAVIEGYISGVGRSGKITGQANVTFNFERITTRDGRSYDFAGYLQSLKDQNGKAVNVDNEGTARSDSQTRETAKRGGIGGGIGAIIGAIAGGAKGAAIGAVIGAGGGASTVVLEGKDDVRLLPGSTMTVQATSPIQRTQDQ